MRVYTCLRANTPGKSRIDFFLTSTNILFTNKRQAAGIRDGYLSDQRIITMSVNIPTTELGKIFWKFKSNLWKDEAFVLMARQNITEIIDYNQNSATSVSLFETVFCVL